MKYVTVNSTCNLGCLKYFITHMWKFACLTIHAHFKHMWSVSFVLISELWLKGLWLQVMVLGYF